jgi:hypothetical protein
MSYYKIITDFTKNRFSNVDLQAKAYVIIHELEGNEDFPTLTTDVEVLKQKQQVFFDLLTRPGYGDGLSTVLKQVARKELEEVLQSIAFKVLDICKGNEILIRSSGFDQTKKRTVVNNLRKPMYVSIKSGSNPGSLLISWNVIQHAYSYLLEYYDITAGDPDHKVTLTCTKRKISVTNLIPGHQYAFRICGVGSCLNHNWSNEIKSFVM